MVLQAKGDLVAARSAYNASRARAEPFDWQGAFRLWRLCSDMGDAEGAAEARAHLLGVWGAAQFAWYSTDVGGTPLDHAAAAPGTDMTVGTIGA